MKKSRKLHQQKRMERKLRKNNRDNKKSIKKNQQEPEAITFHFHDEVTDECLLTITVHKIDENTQLPLSDGDTSGLIDLN